MPEDGAIEPSPFQKTAQVPRVSDRYRGDDVDQRGVADVVYSKVVVVFVDLGSIVFRNFIDIINEPLQTMSISSRLSFIGNTTSLLGFIWSFLHLCLPILLGRFSLCKSLTYFINY